MTLDSLERLMRETQTDGYEIDLMRLANAIEAETALACVAILLDGRYWNGAPSIAYTPATERAQAIRLHFGVKEPKP